MCNISLKKGAALPNGFIDFQCAEEVFHRHLMHRCGRPWSSPTYPPRVVARTPVRRTELASVTPPAAAEPDPYLLVLLADQEIEADRQANAESLIEAAYAAYDQSTFRS